MADRRMANTVWTVADENGNIPTWERVGVAVMMDIRDELKQLNALLSCPNFVSIPRKLEAIRKNTTRPRGKKK